MQAMSLAGIFLVSSSTLLYQIALTRIFSISEWYHFAFMVISLALLGFGISGTVLSIFPSLAKGGFRFQLFSCLFPLSIVLSFIVANRIPFDPFRIWLEPVHILYLVLTYLFLSIPFFVCGLLVGGSLVRFPEETHRIYFANMCGSGIGCFLILTIPFFGGVERIPLVAGYIGLLACFLFGREETGKMRLVLPAAILFLFVFILFLNGSFFTIPVSPYKGVSLALNCDGAELIGRRENAISRVEVIKSPVVKHAPGLSFEFAGQLPEQYGIAIDGENITGISVLREPGDLIFTEYLPGAVCYKLREQREVLVVEPHGGIDVLKALHFGAESITVVESNRLLEELVSEKLPHLGAYGLSGYSENLGSKRTSDLAQKVNTVYENPRTYVARGEKRFDLVVISLKEDFGAVMNGSFSLAEEHLYTAEAIKDYLNILKPGGILLMTRWLQTPPSESLRLCVSLVSALREMGFSNPGERFAFIRGWMTGTFIVSAEGFRDFELEKIRSFSREMKFDLVWLPDIQKDEVNIYNSFPEALHYDAVSRVLGADRENFIRNYEYDISAVRDVRPFFFHFFKWKQTASVLSSLGKRWLPYGGGGYLLITLLLVIALFSSSLLILLPLRFGLSTGGKSPGFLRKSYFFLYFFSLGMGFLFLEICLIHYFIVFVGKPTYAFSLVLASIFVFSSLGSLLSGKLKSIRNLEIILLFICLLIFTYIFCLQRFFLRFMKENLPVRIVLSFGILFPVWTLMGFAFPCGLRHLRSLAPAFVPWVWGINGCASVIASILGMLVAVSRGYNWVLAGASFFYLSAFISARVGFRRE